MNIEDTLAPDSAQLDAVDLLGGPRVFRVESVSKGPADQPVQVHLEGFPRPWRPGKSMRRVLASCWGTEATAWVGRWVELYCDPDVQFGGKSVGGTRVKSLSHIDKAKKIPLLVTRGKSATYVVDPLTPPESAPAAPTPPTDAEIACCTDKALLRAWWEAHPDQRADIEGRVAEFDAAGGEGGE